MYLQTVVTLMSFTIKSLDTDYVFSMGPAPTSTTRFPGASGFITKIVEELYCIDGVDPPYSKGIRGISY